MATTAGTVLLAYLGEQLGELRRHAPGVRAGQAESIHQMRISGRRLRSLLATGRTLFVDGAGEGVRSELKWLSGVLGAARDPGVVQARLQELLAAEPEDLVFGPAAARIDEELEASAAAGLEGVLAALGSERYAQLLAGLSELLAAGALSAKASRRPRKTSRKLVAKDEARLRRAVQALHTQAGTVPRDTRLHEIRKAAKRLRYASEFAATLGGNAGKRAKRAASAARRIQTVLGLHQDSVVARALLSELGRRSPGGAEAGFTYGRLHAKEEQLAAGSEADFLKAWKKFP